MTTVRDIVEGALRLIEEVGEGQQMTAQQGQDGLFALQGLIDSWSLDPAMIATEVQEELTLTGNVGEYTIGSGGDLDTVKPLNIVAATIKDVSVPLNNLEIIGQAKYAQVFSDEGKGTPYYLYYDNNYPLGNIRFYSIPDKAYTLVLYSQKPITNYTSLNDTIVAPQGGDRMLRFNLAVELAPEFGKQAPMKVEEKANESRDLFMGQNIRNDLETSSTDTALLDCYNYDVRVDR